MSSRQIHERAHRRALLDRLRGAWRSRTIWFNAFLIALPELLDQLQANLPALHDYLPESTYKSLALVAIVGNIVLRALTRVPLEAK